MKKLIVSIQMMLSCGAAYALPLGNPSEASFLCDGIFFEGPCYDNCQSGFNWCDAYSIRIGYYGDFVFNRLLDVDEHHSDEDLEKTQLFTNAGYLALNFWDRLDIFCTLGTTNFYLESNASTFSGPNGDRFNLESGTNFSWSIGGRLTIWEFGCTTVGAVGQYFFTKPHVTRVTIAETNTIYPDNNILFKYAEWQLGLGISHRIWNFVPYIGTKFSGVKVDFGDAIFNFTNFDIRLPDLNNRFYWGYVIGVSFIDRERAALTVEGRFRDERAVYVNGQLRF
jgi:major outer membrane protein